MAFGERRGIRGFFRSHVSRSGTTTHVSNKARGWLDHARRADGHEHRAFVQGAEDAIQFERHLAKPADVWANSAAAFAAWKLASRVVGVRVSKRRAAACVAAAAEEFAMHVDDALRSCLLMQVVHVLGAQKKAFSQSL